MQSTLQSLFLPKSVKKAPFPSKVPSLCKREFPPHTFRTSWRCTDDPWLNIFWYNMLENVVLVLQVLNGLLVTKFIDFFNCPNVICHFASCTINLTFSPWAYLLEELIVLWNFLMVLVLYHVLKGKHCIKCNLMISLNRFYWPYTHSLY